MSNKPILTAANILRVLAVLCVIFCFCSIYTLKVFGQEFGISIFKLMTGIKWGDDVLAEGVPGMAVFIAVPVITAVVLFGKHEGKNERYCAVIAAILTVINIIMLVFLRISAEHAATEAFASSFGLVSIRAASMLYVNIIVLVIMLVLCVLIAMNRLGFNNALNEALNGNGSNDMLNQMSASVSSIASSVSQMAGSATASKKGSTENVIGYCMYCGNKVTYGDKFCIRCGKEIPQILLEYGEQLKKEAEKRKAAEEAAKKAAEEEAKRAAEEAAKKAAEEEAKRAAEEASAAAAVAASKELVDKAADEQTKADEAVSSAREAVPQTGSQTAQVFCTNCGAKMPATAKFCIKCGTRRS